MRIRIFYTVVK